MDNKFSGASYEYGTLNKQVLVQKPILDSGVLPLLFQNYATGPKIAIISILFRFR